jgi:hypothetical protein
MFPLGLRALSIIASAGTLNAALSRRSTLTPDLGGLAANITGEDQTFDFVVIGAGTAGIVSFIFEEICGVDEFFRSLSLIVSQKIPR